MDYREYLPTPLLASYLECFWTLRAGPPPEPPPPETLLPDGTLELVLNFGDRFREFRSEGSVLQPQHFFVGELSQSKRIAATGAVDILGLRFKPGGAWPLFGHSLQEFNCQATTSLDLCAADLYRAARDQLPALSTTAERIHLLEQLLLRRAKAGGPPEPLIGRAVASLRQRQGREGIDALAARLAVSERQLERKFREQVGINPKAFARITRFQVLMQAMRQGSPRALTGIALECGFYDQAHFIKEFKAFTGINPKAFLADRHELTDVFLLHNRLSEFYNFL